MKEAIELIRGIITKSRDCHVGWLEYLEAHPEREDEFANSAGDRHHQRTAIANYNKALTALDEIEKTEVELPEGFKLSEFIEELQVMAERCDPEEGQVFEKAIKVINHLIDRNTQTHELPERIAELVKRFTSREEAISMDETHEALTYFTMGEEYWRSQCRYELATEVQEVVTDGEEKTE